MDDVVLMSDPRVTGVPVAEDGAGLVDVTGSLAVDQRKADGSGAWRLLRAPVLERLLDAADRLPRDLRLVVVEGYRPPALQATYFEGYREACVPRTPTVPRRICTGLPAAMSRRRTSRHTPRAPRST